MNFNRYVSIRLNQNYFKMKNQVENLVQIEQNKRFTPNSYRGKKRSLRGNNRSLHCLIFDLVNSMLLLNNESNYLIMISSLICRTSDEHEQRRKARNTDDENRTINCRTRGIVEIYVCGSCLKSQISR